MVAAGALIAGCSAAGGSIEADSVEAPNTLEPSEPLAPQEFYEVETPITTEQRAIHESVSEPEEEPSIFEHYIAQNLGGLTLVEDTGGINQENQFLATSDGECVVQFGVHINDLGKLVVESFVWGPKEAMGDIASFNLDGTRRSLTRHADPGMHEHFLSIEPTDSEVDTAVQDTLLNLEEIACEEFPWPHPLL